MDFLSQNTKQMVEKRSYLPPSSYQKISDGLEETKMKDG